jgi:hypothetical protein
MIGKGAVFGLVFMVPLVAGLGAQARTHHAERGAFACQDEFQSVEGQAIATPYCEDAYLAKVARAHGEHVTASALRRSPSLRDETCRLTDSDTRVSQFCDDDGDDN